MTRGLMCARRRTAGFTLLELLIAIAIFALVAAMAYGGLNSVLNVSERVNEQAERLKALQLTFLWMQRDIEEAVLRPVRDEYGEVLPALRGSEVGTALFEVTRAGWTNPLGAARSNLQRSEYRLEEERLIRRYWRVLDRAQDSEPVDRVMLDGVTRLEFRYWDAQGEHRQWPDLNSSGQPQTAADVMPLGIEVRLETAREGVITRFFRVAG
jgi:general secretion pathway protein J